MRKPDDREPLAARALRAGLAWVTPLVAPLDLRLLGRTLLHAAALGCLAGVAGAAFFAALEIGQKQLLTVLAGYVPLRAAGEAALGEAIPGRFRPWLLALLPAAGGLVSGLITSRLAPECAGGGGDATIEAYHHEGGASARGWRRSRPSPPWPPSPPAAPAGARGPPCRSAPPSAR